MRYLLGTLDKTQHCTCLKTDRSILELSEVAGVQVACVGHGDTTRKAVYKQVLETSISSANADD
jgi:hypothetical protein